MAVAGPGLGRADQEVAGVAQHWLGCETLTGAKATGEAFPEHNQRWRNWFMWRHMVVTSGRARSSSSIRLADGPVVGYDLDRLARPPQQVVLSRLASSGQATVRPGDEALGLTRALLHSGTSTIISGVAEGVGRGRSRSHGRLPPPTDHGRRARVRAC